MARTPPERTLDWVLGVIGGGARIVETRTLLALAREFGATDVVSERGEEAVERVKELTGYGAHSVLECVGTEDAMRTAVEIARPGGAVGRVGVPHYETIPAAEPDGYRAMAEREALKVMVNPS